MKLDSLAGFLLSTGLVTDRNKPGIAKLYLYQAPSPDQLESDTFALLVPPTGDGMAVIDELPNYHKGKIMLITSGRNVDESYDLAFNLSKRLTLHGLDLSDMYIYRCVPRHLPINYRKNEQGTFEHSVNFDIIIRLK